MTDHTTAYANAVVKGSICACKYVQLACQRHLQDLKKSKSKTYPYKFDVDEANRWFKLFDMLKLWKGKWAGQNFKLEPWQHFIVGSLFGWVEKKSGLRRFKKAYIEMARKNAKTTLMAAIWRGRWAGICRCHKRSTG
jgi:phage terminase large subunit-like protein